jgi:uncharacterized membrane protein YphA (DoxX/SURF4 family)
MDVRRLTDAKWQFTYIDTRITTWMARNGITLLRFSLGVVFFWFGVLKLFPALSPAEMLAGRTIAAISFGIIQPPLALPILAVWEMLIGLGLITGRFTRATVALLLLQMLGTLTPLALFPQETWTVFPVAPTLEGQYIIKNLVLISAALVIGATVRGGAVIADPHIAQEAVREEQDKLEQDSLADSRH